MKIVRLRYSKVFTHSKLMVRFRDILMITCFIRASVKVNSNERPRHEIEILTLEHSFWCRRLVFRRFPLRTIRDFPGVD